MTPITLQLVKSYYWEGEGLKLSDEQAMSTFDKATPELKSLWTRCTLVIVAFEESSPDTQTFAYDRILDHAIEDLQLAYSSEEGSSGVREVLYFVEAEDPGFILWTLEEMKDDPNN